MRTILRLTVNAFAFALTILTAQAQVKIGNSPTTINLGSVLELQSTDKGLLMPRVNLTNTNTWSPLAGTPAAGMHVYNTNAAITSTDAAYPTLAAKVGEYYWDGTGWVALGQLGKTSSLIYAGSNVSPVTLNDASGEQKQITIPSYDPSSGYSAGIFTIPVTGWYEISHMWRVKFNGSSSNNGSFGGSINIKQAGGSTFVVRAQEGKKDVQNSYTYASSSSITMYLSVGDQIEYTVTPCAGCPGAGNYTMTDVFQTITSFK